MGKPRTKGANTPTESRKSGSEDKMVELKEIPVAGKEVVGRKIAVWSEETMDWPPAVVAQYDPNKKLHLIRYTERNDDSVKHEEQWVDLGKNRFQWLSEVELGAPPNPSYALQPKGEDAIGCRVRVFWTAMGKWYLGKVIAYDAASHRHTVKYKDGDVQQVLMRHEAVVFLDSPKEKSPDIQSVEKKKRGRKPKDESANQQSKPRKRAKKKQEEQPEKQKRVYRRKSTKGDGKPKMRDGKDVKNPKKSNECVSATKSVAGSSGSEAENATHCQAIVGSRVSVHWVKEGTYFKGKIEKYNNSQQKHLILYDDGEIEWLSLSDQDFRYVSPKTKSGGCSERFQIAMKSFGALDGEGAKSAPAQSRGRMKESQLRDPKDKCFGAVSWKVTIQGGDGLWYGAELIGYDSTRNLHMALFDDGEHEWISVKEEKIVWHYHRADKNTLIFPGKPITHSDPVKKKAVGWRVAVYWLGDMEFFHGEVVDYDEDSDTYEISYDDGEESTIDLRIDRVKWVLPPGAKYDSKAVLQRLEANEESDSIEDPDFVVNNATQSAPCSAKQSQRGRQRGGKRRGTPRQVPRDLPRISVKRVYSSTPSGEEMGYAMCNTASPIETPQFEGEPHVVRKLCCAIPSMADLGSASSKDQKIPSIIAVKIFMSNPKLSDQTVPEELKKGDEAMNSRLKALDLMLRRISRAQECIIRGIPTYLPKSSMLEEGAKIGRIDTYNKKKLNFSKARSSEKKNARYTYVERQEYDSESDNAHRPRDVQRTFSRFKVSQRMPFASSRPSIPVESSSASSDVEGNESDTLCHREPVTSPRSPPFPRGGKVKPSVSPEKRQEESSIEPLMMTAPAPIQSPFSAEVPPMEEENACLDLQMSVPYSESEGNFLHISRNASDVLLGDVF